MPKDANYEQARARKVAAEAEIAELQLEQVKGSLVPATDVVNAWSDVLGQLKAKLMAIPSKAAPIVASDEVPGSCQNVIEGLIREALEELSNYDPKVAAGKTQTPVAKKEDEPPKKRGRGRPKKTDKMMDQ